jgi:hypothetical protein
MAKESPSKRTVTTPVRLPPKVVKKIKLEEPQTQQPKSLIDESIEVPREVLSLLPNSTPTDDLLAEYATLRKQEKEIELKAKMLSEELKRRLPDGKTQIPGSSNYVVISNVGEQKKFSLEDVTKILGKETLVELQNEDMLSFHFVKQKLGEIRATKLQAAKYVNEIKTHKQLAFYDK